MAIFVFVYGNNMRFCNTPISQEIKITGLSEITKPPISRNMFIFAKPYSKNNNILVMYHSKKCSLINIPGNTFSDKYDKCPHDK